MGLKPSKNLQRFENPNPNRDYEIFFDCPEFTCLCPLTGQPDFAQIEIRYYPGPYCVELKSLKQYMWSYRDEGAFHEKVTNTILEDLVAITGAEKMEVKADFLIRGGIRTIITAEYIKGHSTEIPLKENISERTE